MTSNELVDDVLATLAGKDVITPEDVRNAMFLALKNVKLTAESTEIAVFDADKRARQVRKFLACKAIEGCSDKTLTYYGGTIKRLMLEINKPFDAIAVDDLRYYFAIRGSRDNLSKTSQNNERRIFNSFFGWMTANDIIAKDPMRLIKLIRGEKRVKKAFSDYELEKLRVCAQQSLRDNAMLETLCSTGVRVSELVGMNRTNIDGDEITVFGKGKKERVVYLNAKCLLAINRYLDSRTDDNPALFVSSMAPHNRSTIGGVRFALNEIARKSGVSNVHPHRFRRTFATTACKRGMPLEQLKEALGHARIETTLIYVQTANEDVKTTHRRLM